MFEIGRTYNRQADLHAIYGGQQQGGIATPKGRYIFLFTGSSGERYGYSDGWDENGVFLYTGEGKLGDMEFIRGNRAIRDHVQEGKSLLLFESLGKEPGCRHVGEFACSSWEYQQGIDREQQERTIILFHLVPLAIVDEGGEPVSSQTSYTELRHLAYEAGVAAAENTPKEGRRLYYDRSRAVREYVLRRAGGVCEACRQPAPFIRADDQPYLEPHHTQRIADGGADDPRRVGAVCPNCHKEIHYGKNGGDLNRQL